jgi:quinol monooxygenase YgiN
MTTTALVVFETKDGASTDFETAIKALLASTSGDPGFVSCTQYQDLNEPNVYVFHELWQSQSALNEHLSTAHVARFLCAIEPLLERKKVRLLQRLDASPPDLCCQA